MQTCYGIRQEETGTSSGDGAQNEDKSVLPNVPENITKKNCTDVKLKTGQMVTFTDSGDGVQHTAIVFVRAGKQKANTKTGTMCSMLKLIAVRDKNKH